jgi:hypothetical protein
MADNTNQTPITTKDMLQQVNAAIMAIAVGGQSYKIGSRSLTRADLKQLYAIKNDLTAQIAAESSGGLLDDCYVAIFDGR